jgi:hypothetical protein
MKVPLAAVTVLLLAGPALAAPGDPRVLRGNLEWPASLSAEPFIVVRGDDGAVYYADVSGARRMSAAAITGAISIVGIEGNQPHEMAAIVVGPGDSALTFVTPPVQAQPDAAPPPASLPRQTVAPPATAVVPTAPPAAVTTPPSAAVPNPPAGALPNPPAAAVPNAPPAPPAQEATAPGGPEDLWRVSGTVTAVTVREFAVETRPGETVWVDVSKLSAWTRDAVRPGDQVKLFGIPQNDDRLVANGFIQEVPPQNGRR